MYGTGPIRAQGAFTGDFGIAAGTPADRIPGEIERDREIMVLRPGMRHKHVPITIDPATGQVFCGGRYLFDTYQDAEAYRQWVVNEFAVDGVPFPERPYFVDPAFLAWQVVGAHDFEPLETHVAVRMERWALPRSTPAKALAGFWHAAHAEAARQGLASVWLLHSPERRELGLVTVLGRGADQAPRPMEETVGLLLARSLGGVFDAHAVGEKSFDRAGLVWTIWTPRAAPGEAPSLWPNSPPLPAPVPAAV
ncbi:MAG TPA: hypothetical protein VHG08_19275 [Longimicrobium sp.]|nr:hypothetical protein [Longimicrobium sp.]